MNVTIWNEFRHERVNEVVQNIYPNGIHAVIGEALEKSGIKTRTATLDEVEHGLTEEVLASTDVLVWWGHKAHDEVSDEIVDRVYQWVLEGMGLLVLHSGHFSKIFIKLMGTSCNLKWRAVGEKERLWVIDPSHPIVEGIDEFIELDQEEMYGEHFDIPAPDQLVFTSWFEGGEVFRSGCTYQRGSGKIFYFRPGHETFPTYHNEQIQKVIVNAVQWLKPTERSYPKYGNAKPLENLSVKENAK